MAGVVKNLFGIPKLDGLIGEIPRGSNIMLSAPSLGIGETLVKNFVQTGVLNDEGVIYVSTKKSGERIMEWFEEPIGGLRVIDCTSRLTPEKAENVGYVPSLGDLTRIGVHITNFLKELWKDRGMKNIRFCFDSISMLLMYTDIRAVFRFLHVFLGKISSIEGISLIVVDRGMHEAEASMLLQLVEGLLEVKKEGTANFVRFQGFGRDTDWQELEL